MARPIRKTTKKPKKLKKVIKQKKPEFAYIITDKIFGEFKIKNSDNAWWLDREKVHNLISAWKIDATDAEASAYAGITADQYRYFREQHPELSQIKASCKEMPGLKARQTVVQDLVTPDGARWYLAHKKRKEFSTRHENTGADGKPLFNLGEIAKQKLKELE